MVEIRACESAAMDETMSSRIDDDDTAAVVGADVEEFLKPVSREDEVMKDVDSKVPDAGDDVVMDLDLVRDETDSFREVRDGGVLPSRVSDEENQGKQPDGQVSEIRNDEEQDEDDPVELSVSISGSDVRDEDSEGEGLDHSVNRYDSLLSKFDNYASGGGSGSSKAKTFGFQVGDLVWGKVKSHPWWPGHIFNEAFASPSVCRTHREGHMLVAFFGDSSYGWFDPTELVPFNDNFAEKSKQTSAKSFIKAVDEAVDEVCRRRSLGITCRCRNSENFRPADEEGYFAIDLVDYDYVAVYPQRLIDRARDRFTPLETIRFISQLAKRPLNCDHKSLDLSENKAVVMQLRKAMFEEFDDTYSEAFGYPPDRPTRAPKNLGDDSLRVQARAQLSGPLVIAETLHGKKNSKSVKVKDQSKKNKYVLIHSATDLKELNLIGKMDPYVSVYLSGDPNSKQKTEVDTDGGKNPKWKGKPMKFVINEDLGKNSNVTLVFKIMAEKPFGDKDVGEVYVPVKDLLEEESAEKSVSYSVKTPSGKTKGTLHFSYKLGENYTVDINDAAAKNVHEPVMAYPPDMATGSSSHGGVYPPQAPPPYEAGLYPPQAGYGGYPPPPPQHGYPPAGYAPPQPGYGYPGAPPPPGPYGYPGYPPAPGYPPQQVVQPHKKNKMGGMGGMGLGIGAGLLGGLLIGDMVSDVGEMDAGFADGADFDF